MRNCYAYANCHALATHELEMKISDVLTTYDVCDVSYAQFVRDANDDDLAIEIVRDRVLANASDDEIFLCEFCKAHARLVITQVGRHDDDGSPSYDNEFVCHEHVIDATHNALDLLNANKIVEFRTERWNNDHDM